ncbi:MAG: hypothetical protein NTW86_25415 [Candidatus Sumerlaeota bacterium]|nr:hypothetical protein [Candidatus Sumerlaeota bacterium]
MNDDAISAMLQEVNALVDEYRGRCLWFLREDSYSATSDEACRVLGH